MDKNEFKVYRTLEGTIFEVVTVLLVFASILITMLLSSSTKDQMGMALGGIVLGCCAILFLLLAYHPNSEWINLPVKRTNFTQLAITVRMMRVIAIELGLMSLFMSLLAANIIRKDKMHESVLEIIIVAVLFLTSGYYVRKINKAKNL